MNNLQVIEQREVLNKDFKIYGDKDQPLFLAKDVAEWIDYDTKNTYRLLNQVDDEEKTLKSIHTLGGYQEAWLLTEDGLYEVLMQSRKPIAKAFKKEVKAILKQIRQTGGYINVQEEDDAETLMAKALMVAQNTLNKKEKLLKEKDKVITSQNQVIESKEIELTDKNRFINQISASNDCILVGDLAHIITKQGFKIGQNRLFAQLRDWKLLQQNNKPYQRALEQGLFEVSEFAVQTNHGIKLRHTTRVTGKGQVYIITKLLKELNQNG